MVVHVLDCDSAPHADHERLDLALVCPASNAEETIFSPVLPPGVGSDLEMKIDRSASALDILMVS